ncbi:MAG: hemerythrin family protein [Paludibacter sp.]|nr:hemerythrin family protein [Paludibacter sp.]
MDTKINESSHKSWNNSYLLDIPMIDKQHINFFKLFDKLMLMSKENDSYENINEVILELEKYTYNHFNTEESLMRNANVENIDFHILQHKLFIDKVEEFKLAYTYRNMILVDQMVVFMRKWFLMHISEVDRNYANTVREYLEKRNQ